MAPSLSLSLLDGMGSEKDQRMATLYSTPGEITFAMDNKVGFDVPTTSTSVMIQCTEKLADQVNANKSLADEVHIFPFAAWEARIFTNNLIWDPLCVPGI